MIEYCLPTAFIFGIFAGVLISFIIALNLDQ